MVGPREEKAPGVDRQKKTTQQTRTAVRLDAQILSDLQIEKMSSGAVERSFKNLFGGIIYGCEPAFYILAHMRTIISDFLTNRA